MRGEGVKDHEILFKRELPKGLGGMARPSPQQKGEYGALSRKNQFHMSNFKIE